MSRPAEPEAAVVDIRANDQRSQRSPLVHVVDRQ
jgi:hypothetical protein